jgi:hypothetical protein
MSCSCFIVPPHILKGIADSDTNSASVRQDARASLESCERMQAAREERLDALLAPGAHSHSRPTPRPFIPKQLLQKISESESVDEEVRKQAKTDLAQTEKLETAEQQIVGLAVKERAFRAVYDGNHTDPVNPDLPGELIRVEVRSCFEDVLQGIAEHC